MKFNYYLLKDFVHIKYGKNQKNVAFNKDSYPIYGTGGLIRHVTKFLYDKTSVLIGRKGTIDRVKYAQKTSKRSTMPYAIWDGGLGDFKIIIPSQKILNDFNISLLPCIKKIQNSYFENLCLSQFRDALLPKLMSGEVDVSRVK